MSWLSHALKGIRIDSHTLGNLAKNVSPALAFTPLGPLGAFGLSALGDLGRGKNLKQAAIGGVENAAIGSGLHAGAGLLSSAIHGGAGAAGSVGSAAGSVASDAAPAAVAPTTSIGGVILPAPAAAALPAAASGAGAAASGGGVLSSALHGAGKVGQFALDHDKTTSAVLGGLGNLGTMGAENRATNAQAKLLEQQANESAYDFAQRKARDLAMEPLRLALQGSLGGIVSGNNSHVAANPYLNQPAGAP